MKKLLFLLTLLLSFNLYSQDYKRDVYSVLECLTDDYGKLVCNEKSVDYEFNINTTLSWFFLFDKKNDLYDKIVSMDIKGFNNVNKNIWIYELIDDNEKKYNITLDEKRGMLILFPIHSISDKNIKISSIIFRFKNPIKI